MAALAYGKVSNGKSYPKNPKQLDKQKQSEVDEDNELGAGEDISKLPRSIIGYNEPITTYYRPSNNR